MNGLLGTVPQDTWTMDLKFMRDSRCALCCAQDRCFATLGAEAPFYCRSSKRNIKELGDLELGD